MVKNLDKKKLLSIIVGLIIMSTAFYYVHENLTKRSDFIVCIYPINNTFKQGEKLPVEIEVKPNTNDFQSHFSSSSCVDYNSAYLMFSYLGVSNYSALATPQECTTFINGTCYFTPYHGTVPFSISSYHPLYQKVYWNGTIHMSHISCTNAMFVEANAGYYRISQLITLDFGNAKYIDWNVNDRDSVIALSGLFVNYSIEDGTLNFNFSQFHSACQFNNGSLTILGTNGTKLIYQNLKFPGDLSLNVTDVEKQTGQNSISGDIGIVHNRYGNIWLILS
ncbi:hypothetical protein ACNF40_05005 [Cuniculiplasma sp. SKW4]|uniref:hypothetical protein n=1 Tax=Cuniculiplasma sp. SKW4 TaxID=3400171 RepID=UPI003FD027EF